MKFSTYRGVLFIVFFYAITTSFVFFYQSTLIPMYSSNPYGKSAKLYSILSILMKYDVVERIDQTRLISRISGPYTKLIVRGKINSIPTQEIVQPNNFQQSDMADKFLADNNGMLSEAAIVVHFYNTYDRLEIWIKNE